MGLVQTLRDKILEIESLVNQEVNSFRTSLSDSLSRIEDDFKDRILTDNAEVFDVVVTQLNERLQGLNPGLIDLSEAKSTLADVYKSIKDSSAEIAGLISRITTMIAKWDTVSSSLSNAISDIGVSTAGALTTASLTKEKVDSAIISLKNLDNIAGATENLRTIEADVDVLAKRIAGVNAEEDKLEILKKQITAFLGSLVGGFIGGKI